MTSRRINIIGTPARLEPRINLSGRSLNMKRILSTLSAALAFFALAFALSQPARVARAADINEKCTDCQLRNEQRFEHCQAIHGTSELRCYDEFNQGIVNCFRNFCEQ